jgi:hypothetical protein
MWVGEAGEVGEVNAEGVMGAKHISVSVVYLPIYVSQYKYTSRRTTMRAYAGLMLKLT